MGSVNPNRGGVVLIVDDDDDSRALLRNVLELERWFVLEAADGRDALEILRSEAASSIDLITLDLLMPCMSGWELLEVMRSDPALSLIPVLVTSGVPVHGDASGIGATLQWVRKPFAQSALLAAVREAQMQQGPSAKRRQGAAAERKVSSPSHRG
jgi:CheY-like chemotaxis protein